MIIRPFFCVHEGSAANQYSKEKIWKNKYGLFEKVIEYIEKYKCGDEVITVAASFPTTVSAIVQYGAVPVLIIDMDIRESNIGTTQLEVAYSPKALGKYYIARQILKEQCYTGKKYRLMMYGLARIILLKNLLTGKAIRL